MAGLLAIGSPAYPQSSPSDVLADGVKQLEGARQQRTEMAFASAEETFTKVLAVDPSNPRALVYRGEARIMRGVMLIRRSLPSALEHFQSGMADMDSAVSIAPDDVMVRIVRGLSYVEFPPFYNKQAVAREDLEAALAHPLYATLSQPLRDHVLKALERARGARVDSQQSERPDRFLQVASTISPIMAVASVTFARIRPTDRPAWLETIMEELNQAPGLIAARSATSFEHPGMVLIFAWFQDKKALNDFFYGEAHQRWIRQHRGAISGGETRFHGDSPEQVGIELFSVLPGGMTWGGGLVPPEAKRQ
jgi:hypothetical protein